MGTAKATVQSLSSHPDACCMSHASDTSFSGQFYLVAVII